VISRTYALDDMVDAHRFVDDGHKRGNVVIGASSGRDRPPIEQAQRTHEPETP
jgi:hypothetical protein